MGNSGKKRRLAEAFMLLTKESEHGQSTVAGMLAWISRRLSGDVNLDRSMLGFAKIRLSCERKEGRKEERKSRALSKIKTNQKRNSVTENNS